MTDHFAEQLVKKYHDPKDDLKRQDPPTWYDKPSYPN